MAATMTTTTTPPPPHQVALQEFFRWERQSWVEVVADITTDEKAQFMPVDTLKSYFRGNGGRKLKKILSEVFESSDIPLDPDVILRGHTAVFCILLRISKGKFIEEFAYFEELSDQRLPFDPAHRPAHFPEDDEDPSFLQRFCETQWMYCVPVFGDHMSHRYFGPERLLPIVQKEVCKGDRDVVAYKIKLYGPHNKLIPAGSEMQTNPTDPNTFLVKRYLKKEEYRQEVKNFSSSKHSESITRFHGCYTHGASYNILLEYADKGSLEGFFKSQTPPSRGSDIIKFWENTFLIIKALKAIHSFLGGHHCVNPSSVLVLSYGAESPFDWRFKLGDFGSGSSVARAGLKEGLTGNGCGASQTYGAPECYTSPDEVDGTRKRSSKNTQAADIWSLGCIYSEAAVWVADGYDGVVDYRRQRMAEIERIAHYDGGDCFHDGERVLKAVLNAHKEVEHRLRRSDYITKDVLDSMAEEMLWEEERPGAKALLRRAEGIVSRARQRLTSSKTAAPKSTISTTTQPSIRPNSSSSRSRPYVIPQSPPHPPPERPLPERPRVSTSRSNSSQRQSPANVETWRTLVRVPSSDLASSAYGGETRTSPGSELDTDVASSTSGWQGQGGNRESLASPYTSPFASPHTSSHFDYPRPGVVPLERRRGPSPSQRSSSRQRPTGKRPHRQSLKDTVESSDAEDGLVGPSSSQLYAEFMQESINTSSIDTRGNGGPIIDILRNSNTESRPSSSAYAPSMTGSAQSRGNNYALPPLPVQDDIPYPINPQRRTQGGFSLFPTRSTSNNNTTNNTNYVNNNNNNIQTTMPPPPLPPPPAQFAPQPLPTPPPTVDIPISKPASATTTTTTTTYSDHRSMTRSDSISNGSISTITTSQYNSYSAAHHLSLSAVLEWKKKHKKSKKTARVPPVRGADLLDKLNNRDHVFIISDTATMTTHWPLLLDTFAALSYILKPCAPDGIELFFTNAYDAWRRHNTSELVDLLAKKSLVAAETDAAYRIGLQLTDWMLKSRRAAAAAATAAATAAAAAAAAGGGKKTGGKKDANGTGTAVRPVSFYILTDGKWKEGSSPADAIREVSEHIRSMPGLGPGCVTIQFVTFGDDPKGQRRVEEVVNGDYGLDIVDAAPATGDVLKMLCGPLDKGYFLGGSSGGSSGGGGSSNVSAVSGSIGASTSTLMLPMPLTLMNPPLSPIELA